MRRYPHCKITHRLAFYGIVLAVLVAGVTGREAMLGFQAPLNAPSQGVNF